MSDDALAVSTAELELERLRGSQRHAEEYEQESRHPKRRIPRPGCYPVGFSAYRLEAGMSSGIPLSRWELKRDLAEIAAGYKSEFKSTYFDEDCSANREAPDHCHLSIPEDATEAACPSNNKKQKRAHNVVRT
eukprot:CAMPEP_0181294160 /NCGR_PEP_ID=MMETSP1101-20121128/3447_1 /TAXON_ID=46948 /ORGANISM="Rhodomonas abbreviata, Strain Caron Lab Isolate" /LENGTH=132 /DNA_ID=CAMNT_0023398789 /DNA_START=63 /DNA_END=461 /DNA_ORIENTATION=+